MHGGRILTSGTDDQTDALLAEAAGTTRTFAINNPAAPGGRRELTYRVHARSECILCHNPWVEKKTTIFGFQSASLLGVNTPQLNKALKTSDGSVNQLTALYEAGLLSWMPEPARLPRLANPYDESAEVGHRARSYLQTNCSHCHQFGAGGSANIALGFEVPLDQTKTVDVQPIQGTFQIAGRGSSHPGIRRARCCTIASPRSEAAGCPGSARSRSTCARSG